MSENFTLTPELAKELDKSVPSIVERANTFWSMIPMEVKEVTTTYDLACFCLEFLTLESQNNITFIQDEVKTLASKFYYGHYLRTWLDKMESDKAREQDGIHGSSGTISESDQGTTGTGFEGSPV